MLEPGERGLCQYPWGIHWEVIREVISTSNIGCRMMLLLPYVNVLVISDGYDRDELHVQVLRVGVSGSDLDAFSYTILKEESIDTPKV